MVESYEDLILERQEARDEYYSEDETVTALRPLEEVYPFLFHSTRRV